MSLERFKTAQDSRRAGFDTALAELQAGEKTSHWIWYIFPQIAGLGWSSMARTYGIANLGEAKEYLRDPMLCDRLLQITTVVAKQLAAGVALPQLMGGELDARKLMSSLTLFETAAAALLKVQAMPDVRELHACIQSVLALAAAEGFPRCALTQGALARG